MPPVPSPSPCCSSTAAIPAFAETPDDQLVVGFSMTNVLTLDPAAITGREPVQILANVYDGLVSLDATNRAQVNPDLAESWEVVRRQASITFHLRDGANFASGNPVTAEDVVWSLNRLMTLNLAQATSLKTHGFTAENAAASFVAKDERTVVINLPKPVDPQIIIQTLGIVGPGSVLDSALVKENEKDGDWGAEWLNTHSAGSGAFTFEDWRANDRVILTRNDELLGRAERDEAHHHAPHPGVAEPAADAGAGRPRHRLLARPAPDLKALSEEEGVEVLSQPRQRLLLSRGQHEGRAVRQPQGARGAALPDRLPGHQRGDHAVLRRSRTSGRSRPASSARCPIRATRSTSRRRRRCSPRRAIRTASR